MIGRVNLIVETTTKRVMFYCRVCASSGIQCFEFLILAIYMSLIYTLCSSCDMYTGILYLLDSRRKEEGYVLF